MIGVAAIGLLIAAGVLIWHAIDGRNQHKGPDPPYPPIPE